MRSRHKGLNIGQKKKPRKEQAGGWGGGLRAKQQEKSRVWSLRKGKLLKTGHSGD